MQHTSDILNGMQLPIPVRQGKVIPLPTQPVVAPPMRIVDEVTCPVCKDAGRLRSNEFGPHTGHKTVEVPCPRCAPRRRAQSAATRQAALVERVFGGPQIPYRAREWNFTTFPAE